MSLTPAQEAQQILQDSNTILHDDHFVYISGQHGSGWIDKDALLPYPEKTARLAELLVASFNEKEIRAEIICGPAIGGLIMAQWVSYWMKVPFVFVEHESQTRTTNSMRGKFVLSRGFDKLVTGKKILIVDDIINTGHSIRQTAVTISAAGGNIIGAAAYCTRGNVDSTGLGVARLDYLLELRIPSWAASECKLCAENKPINVEHAHGLDFIKSRSAHR